MRLLARLTLKLTSFCCKYNILNKIVNRDSSANQNRNYDTSNIVRYNPNRAIEIEPLKNQRFAALEDIS